ncbi:MAG: nucleotide exchange factor GrpE, partial [Haliscomenobacter sp.]
KLFSTLRNMGLEAMDTYNQPFDPEFHEAITEVPVPDEALKGKIVDTVEKGYKLSDKIIRYAKVVVGK